MRIDKFTLALLNQKLVMRTIWENDSINKSEIARLTGLSLPTVAKITERLLSSRVIRTSQRDQQTTGRRIDMYEFAGDGFFSLGLELSPSAVKVVLIDLTGKTVRSGKQMVRDFRNPDAVLCLAVKLLKEVLTASAVSENKILGIGVGMPGILDSTQTKVLFSPNFHWENVELKDILERQLTEHNILIPVYLENANRALAIGEQYFGAGAGYDYFVCINLGHGIGAASVEGGRLCSGASGTSGELGHIIVEKDGPLCSCGNHGCLEALASGRALAQQARNMISSGVASIIPELAQGISENIEARTVFQAARDQDPAALELVRQAGEYIGIGISNYISLLDPEAIILAGGMSNEDILIQQIQKSVKFRRMRFAGRRVKIMISQLGEYGTAIGAAAIQLKYLIEQGGLPLTKGQEAI